MKKMSLFEFIKPEVFGDVFFEAEVPNNVPAVVPRSSPDWFKGFNGKFGGKSNVLSATPSYFSSLSPNGQALKQELIKFMPTQLPAELLQRSNNNFASVIMNPAYKNYFIMLLRGVDKWLKTQQDVVSVRELTSIFGNNLTQLVDALAPEVTAVIGAL